MRAFCPALCFRFLPAKYWMPPKTIAMLAIDIGISSSDFMVTVYALINTTNCILPSAFLNQFFCKDCTGFINICSVIHQYGGFKDHHCHLQYPSCPPSGSKVAPCKWSPMSGSLISNHRWLTLAFSISGRGYFTRYSFSRGFNPSPTLPYFVESCFFSPIKVH